MLASASEESRVAIQCSLGLRHTHMPFVFLFVCCMSYMHTCINAV